MPLQVPPNGALRFLLAMTWKDRDATAIMNKYSPLQPLAKSYNLFVAKSIKLWFEAFLARRDVDGELNFGAGVGIESKRSWAGRRP